VPWCSGRGYFFQGEKSREGGGSERNRLVKEKEVLAGQSDCEFGRAAGGRKGPTTRGEKQGLGSSEKKKVNCVAKG